MISTRCGTVCGILLFLLLAGQAVSAVPIHDAINRGDVKAVKKILTDDAAQANVVDPSGCAPLLLALNNDIKHQDEIVKLLVASGADVKSTFPQVHITPVMLAALKGHLSWVKLFTEKGADITARDAHGMTLMHFAAVGNDIPVLEWVLAHGGSVTALDINQCTPLHAVYNDPSEHDSLGDLMGKAMLSALVDDIPDFLRGMMEAEKKKEMQRQAAAAEWLVKHGADVNATTLQGNTPLLDAAGDGCADGVQFLLKKGARLDVANASGETALYLAASNGESKLLTFLCAKCDVNVKTHAGDTPLHAAASAPDHAAVKLLLALHADPNTANKLGETPLHNAVGIVPNDRIITMLVKAKADLNAHDIDGNTPLHYAARGGFSDNVVTLCHLGADPTVKNNAGKTPMQVAAGDKQKEVIAALKKAGAKE